MQAYDAAAAISNVSCSQAASSMPSSAPLLQALWFKHLFVLPDLPEYCAGVVWRV